MLSRETRRPREMAAALLAILLVVGCGGVAPVPGEEAVLRSAQDADISTLDPAIGWDIYTWSSERLIFEAPLMYDDGINLVPRLAEQMPEISSDGRTIRFTIRAGVNFVKPNGEVLREVQAEDFVYSLNRVLRPDLEPAPAAAAETLFRNIEGALEVIEGRTEQATGIRASDARQLEITLLEPDPAFLNVLALPFASVVPREHAGTDTSAFSQSPIGTGPYLLAEWQPGEVARFVRNPHYWDSDFAGPAGIELQLGVDPGSQLQRVQRGELHVMTDNIPAGQFDATSSEPRWADYLRRARQFATGFLAMDTTQDGPLGNVLVRRAINHAIDKENVIRIRNGRGLPATCLYPPQLPGYEEDCNPYPFDVEAARRLLREAGYEEGFSTTLYLEDAESDRRLAQAIQQDLAAIGISVELVPQQFSTLLESMAIQHQTPLLLNAWFMDYPDPSNFVEPLLTCASIEGGFNPAWYCSEQVDALVADARRQTPEQRIETYRQIQRLVMADAPWVPTHHPETTVLVHPTVTNFALHPVWRFDYERYRLAP